MADVQRLLLCFIHQCFIVLLLIHGSHSAEPSQTRALGGDHHVNIRSRNKNSHGKYNEDHSTASNVDIVPHKYISSGPSIAAVRSQQNVYGCQVEHPTKAAAHFLHKTSLVSVKKGENAKLECDAYGAKPITISWSRQTTDGSNDLTILSLRDDNGLNSHNNHRQRFTTFEKDFGDTSCGNRTIFELHITSILPTDDGVYICKVNNNFGADEKTIKLRVLDIPSTPRNVMIDQIWSRSASVSWLEPENSVNNKLHRYIIQYWRDMGRSATTHRLYEEITTPTQTSLVLRDKLQPGTSYALRVLAENESGRGNVSAEVKFSTQEEEPNAAPIDIVTEAKGTTTLMVKWKAPPRDHWNGQLRGYYIGFRQVADDVDFDAAGDASQFQYRDVQFTGGPHDNYQQEYLFSDLKKATSYVIVIKAYNDGGTGPISQQILTSTSDNDPPPAPAIWIGEVTVNSIHVKWNQKGNLNDLTHYILYYKDDKSSWLEIAFPAGDANEYQLTDLNGGTLYQLYMKTMSKRGSSEPSDVLTIQTIGENIEQSERTSNVKHANQVPAYLQSILIIPVTIAIVIIVVVCAVAYVYIKYEEKKAVMLHSGMLSQSPSKNFQYINTMPDSSSTTSQCQSMVSEEGSLTLRYSDYSDKSKPLLARPPIPTVLWAQQQGPIAEENEDFPSPYATLPLKKLTSFAAPTSQPPPPPPPLPTGGFSENRRFSQDDRNRIGNIHQRQMSAGANMFCTADVHSCQDDGREFDHLFVGQPHHV